MIKKIWGRRRKKVTRHNSENNIDLPHLQKSRGERKKRKKGVRRRRAAALFLGLSTIMPVPNVKLIHPATANVKKSVASSTSKKRLEKGSHTIFTGQSKGQVQLWIPPSFASEICESKVTPVGVNVINPEDLMPALPYSDIVYPVSMKYNVDWRLVAAVIQAESGFNPEAVSPVGARGLMQLMPATAADYGVTLKSIHDPEVNVEAGVRHLQMLWRLYDGDLPLIAAAYNAGQGTVAKFNGIPPFEETQTYVERVLSYYNSFAAA